MIDGKDDKSMITDLDKVNYYNDKIKKNNSFCRKRLVIYIFLFIVHFFTLSDLFNPFIDLVITFLLIISFSIWWVITDFRRRKYTKNMILSAKNNSFVECDNCKNYKYIDKKCEYCGNDNSLTNDDKVELLYNYNEESKSTPVLRNVSIIIIIIFEIILIIFLLSLPSKANGDLAVLMAYGLVLAGIFFSVIITCILCFAISSAANRKTDKYYAKKSLLKDKENENNEKTNRE